MLSLGTWYQIEHTIKYHKQVGIRRDYRTSDNDNEFPVYLQLDGQEMYWATKDETVIQQSEFNSLGLSFMHFMDPELNYKTNPYKMMKVWVDLGEERKTPMWAVQQVYKDTIRCKLIGTPEQIEAVKKLKKYEECIDIKHELDRIRGYSGNDFKALKEEFKATNLINKNRERVTPVEEYEGFSYEIMTSWRSYKRQKTASRRLAYLEEQIIKIEEYTFGMTETEKAIYEIMAREYRVSHYDIDERYRVGEECEKIAQKFETTISDVWKAYWVSVESSVKKEYEWLEEQLSS